MNHNVIPTFALIIAAGILFGYAMPTWAGPITEKRTAITSDDQALSAATAYSRQQNELAAARNAIDPADLARLGVFLPDSVDNVGIILDLNAVAARNGLTLSNIDVLAASSASDAKGSATQSSTAKPVGSVDLSLSAVGTYPALQSFLRGVEKSQRLLDVRDIVVKGSDTGVYTYQMKITLYWLR